MKVNADLRQAYDRLAAEDRGRLVEFWRTYEAACELAVGADRRRSAHWQERRSELEDDLRRRIAACAGSGK